MAFSRREYWSGLPCPPPGHFPNPGIEPKSPAWQVDSLLLVALGKPSLSSLFWNLSCEIISPLFDRIYKGMSLMWCKPPPRCCQALAVRAVGQVIIVVHLLCVLFVIVLNISWKSLLVATERLSQRGAVITCLLSACLSWLLRVVPAGLNSVLGFKAKLFALCVENYDRMVI